MANKEESLIEFARRLERERKQRLARQEEALIKARRRDYLRSKESDPNWSSAWSWGRD